MCRQVHIKVTHFNITILLVAASYFYLSIVVHLCICICIYYNIKVIENDNKWNVEGILNKIIKGDVQI